MLDSLQIKSTFENFNSLEKETYTIHHRFQRMGYIESELLQLEKVNDSSYLANFLLGKKYSQIKIFYSKPDFTQKELQQISPEVSDTYFKLTFETIPNSLNKLTAILNQRGNAFARLRLSEFEKDETGTLTATLTVESGNIRTIDSIAIKGYEKFPRSFIKYYAGIKKKAIFNQRKLVEQNKRLNSLGFVSTLKAPEALFRKDSTTVYFYLEKQNNNLFDGILGFATDEETQNLTFNGYLNLELNNNLNYGEQVLLNYKADGKEQVNFRAKISLPYLFKTPIGLAGELTIFKRDSTFITTQQKIQTTYHVSPKSIVYFGYKGYDSSNLLDIVVAGSPVEDFKSKFLVAGATYSNPQNNMLFPEKTIINIEGGIGARKKDGSKDDQIRLETLLNNIFNLNQKNSIFVQNVTSVLFSDSYLVNELFRFGGINSIRGFNENSIDASLYSILNTEYRYQFNEGIYLHSIIDVGYFENKTLLLKQNLYSFGLGIGLNTKAGIFKFNVANGNTEDQKFNFSNTKVHISITSRF